VIRVLRSELVRLGRPKLIAGWFGLVAVFSALISQVMFSTATEGNGPAGGPGAGFPSLSVLESADGALSGLSGGATFFGVVTLSFWAVATATDHTTGLIRLLASAEPRRWRLLLGKAAALGLVTAGAAATATVVVAVASPALASAGGVDTSAWSLDLGQLVEAWANSYSSMLVWGALGLVVAVIARSSGVAIAAGVGYVLVVETIVQQALGQGTTWLLGSVLTALAAGGDDSLSHASAAALALGYAVAGMAVATVVFTTRDIDD
jgi:hypothetical protein